MTPEQSLQELKNVDSNRIEMWTLPLRIGRGDAIAAELIEIALSRLGDGAEWYQLLDVASSFFWWVQTLAALKDPNVQSLATKDSSTTE